MLEHVNGAAIGFFGTMIFFLCGCAWFNHKVRTWGARYDHAVGRHRITGDTYNPPVHIHMIDALRSPMREVDGVLYAKCAVVGCEFETQLGAGLRNGVLQENGDLR
jgi:hypothetical protein